MKQEERSLDLHRLFYPRSIAVVGASPKLGGGGKIPFYQILKLTGYPGSLYPVNPAHKEIDGEKVFPSLEDVPDGVDLALCSVPARFALKTVEVAAKKDVGFLHFFTSGFSEMGKKDLEEAMIRAARKGKTRIVGPNCLGVHCTESKVTFDPTLRQKGPGNVAFLGQSGGVTNNVTRMICARQMGINKAVSYGNQIDLRVEDFLGYLARDDTIRTVAAYIEDIKDGRAFLKSLSELTANKPVVILKGGVTEEGARAAESHTGAMAGRQAVWSAVMRQFRCIEVETQKQMVDLVMLASSEKIPRGTRLGYLGAGGGTSVLFTDLAVKAGLSLPELSRRAQDLISEKIPDVNTSTRNPVDLGAFGFSPEVMTHSMRAVDTEENIDGIILYMTLDLLRLFEAKQVETGLHAIASCAREVSKPVIPIMAKAAEGHPRLEELRAMAFGIFQENGIAMYNSIQETVNAIRSILQWSSKTAG